MKEFIKVVEEALPCPANTSAAQRWKYLRDTIYNAALLTFGNKQAKTVDWFEAHLDEIQPFNDEKRRALASYKSSPSEKTLQMLRAVRSKVHQKFKGVVQMTFGFSCAITYRSVVAQAI